MDNKDIERLGSQLDVSMAFLKAAEEVKALEAERDKRIHEKAVKAAENRRKAAENRAAYEEWRRENPPTEEEKAEHRRKFKELVGKCRRKGGGNDEQG